MWAPEKNTRMWLCVRVFTPAQAPLFRFDSVFCVLRVLLRIQSPCHWDAAFRRFQDLRGISLSLFSQTVFKAVMQI